MGRRPIEAGGQRERLEPGRHVDGGVGVQGAAATVVAGVEGGQQVHHLGAADLADDQPVGTHPQGLPDQGAEVDGPLALDVGRPPLESDDVRMVRAQLGGVLDEDEPLGRIDEGEQRREERRLAAARASADQEGHPRRDQRLQQLGTLRSEGAGVEQLARA